MALDRWIALIILLIAIAYGYAAFFTLDTALPPFMRNNPVWPSTFPKIIAGMAVIFSLIILLGFEKSNSDAETADIDYRRLTDYHLITALSLIGLMIIYALVLRPFGFIGATIGFLVISAIILGERNFKILLPTTAIATGIVWYLVQIVLGIFLSPWPSFISSGAS